LSPAEIAKYRELVERIASSKHFRKSARQVRFLSFICELAWTQAGRDIHEQEIGVSVFDRDEGYDTSQDNIVRVNASDLRRRLEKYFAAEGFAEPVLIVIPKGRYVPQFVLRTAVGAADLAPGESAWQGRRIVFLYALPVLCCALLVTSLWLGFQNRELRRLAIPVSTSPKLDLLWSQLLPEGSGTDVVIADSCLSLLQDILRKPFSLQDYVTNSYAFEALALGQKSGREREVGWLTTRRYTSLADVQLLSKLLLAAEHRANRITVHFARDYPAEKARTATSVLVGSKRSNPWVELFEEKMNFRLEYLEESAQSVIYNRRPKEGEHEKYMVAAKSLNVDEGFAVVAFLPNPTRTGSVLILAGTGMQGTSAAADLITREDEFARLLDLIGNGQPVTKLPYFEVLLKNRIMGGAVRGFEFVAHRVAPEIPLD
jgi:hypothetical protein